MSKLQVITFLYPIIERSFREFFNERNFAHIKNKKYKLFKERGKIITDSKELRSVRRMSKNCSKTIAHKEPKV